MRQKIAPFAVLVATLLYGQTMFGQSIVNTGPALLPPPNASRYGNILFPGGTPAAPPAPRLGSLVPNRGQYSGGYFSPPSRGGNQPGNGRTIVVPYAYPVYFNDNGY